MKNYRNLILNLLRFVNRSSLDLFDDESIEIIPNQNIIIIRKNDRIVFSCPLNKQDDNTINGVKGLKDNSSIPDNDTKLSKIKKPEFKSNVIELCKYLIIDPEKEKIYTLRYKSLGKSYTISNCYDYNDVIIHYDKDMTPDYIMDRNTYHIIQRF